MPDAMKPPADGACIEHRIDVGCRLGRGGDTGSEGADRLIARLAARQHGVVARSQLLEAGLGRGAIATRLERGRLHLLHLGVYAVGHPVVSRHGTWMAAVLACGPGAVLSHRSAAQLRGIARPTGHVPEVTRPRKFRARRGIRARRSLLPDDERGVVDGIPVTSVPRTIIDLAALGNRRDVERAIHETEVRGLYDRLSIVDLMRRYPRRVGSGLLREVLGAEVGATINRFEEDFASLLERHGLPMPRFNADLVVRGRAVKPDCLWADEQLIIELDGGAVHRTKQKFETDRERDRTLTVAGWTVIRVTWRQLRKEPEGVVADVRRLLHRTKPASNTA